MIKEHRAGTDGVTNNLTERLKNAVSASPKALETIIDFYQTSEPKELTQKVLSSLLKDCGFNLEYVNFDKYDVNALIYLAQDQCSVLMTTHLLTDLDKRNRIYLRVLAYLALKSSNYTCPNVIIERIHRSPLDKVADKWLSDIIRRQLQPAAKSGNPCMQGILEATNDLRKPPLGQSLHRISMLSSNFKLKLDQLLQ